MFIEKREEYIKETDGKSKREWSFGK